MTSESGELHGTANDVGEDLLVALAGVSLQTFLREDSQEQLDAKILVRLGGKEGRADYDVWQTD